MNIGIVRPGLSKNIWKCPRPARPSRAGNFHPARRWKLPSGQATARQALRFSAGNDGFPRGTTVANPASATKHYEDR